MFSATKWREGCYRIMPVLKRENIQVLASTSKK